MSRRDRDPASGIRTLGMGMVLALLTDAGDVRARQAAPSPGPSASTSASSEENLTVHGHRHRFESAPLPGGPLTPPPERPSAHLGRYKISGDQAQRDGYDAQTGAFIAPFGSAYTEAGPTADGLASRFQH